MLLGITAFSTGLPGTSLPEGLPPPADELAKTISVVLPYVVLMTIEALEFLRFVRCLQASFLEDALPTALLVIAAGAATALLATTGLFTGTTLFTATVLLPATSLLMGAELAASAVTVTVMVSCAVTVTVTGGPQTAGGTAVVGEPGPALSAAGKPEPGVSLEY